MLYFIINLVIGILFIRSFARAVLCLSFPFHKLEILEIVEDSYSKSTQNTVHAKMQNVHNSQYLSLLTTNILTIALNLFIGYSVSTPICIGLTGFIVVVKLSEILFHDKTIMRLGSVGNIQPVFNIIFAVISAIIYYLFLQNSINILP